MRDDPRRASRRRSKAASTPRRRSARSPSGRSIRCSSAHDFKSGLLARASGRAARWNFRVRHGDDLPQQPRRARAACWRRSAALLRPIQKLFWNPTPMIAALSRQSDLNTAYAHLLHNLVLEVTRLNLEVAGPQEPEPAAPGPPRVPGPAGEDAGGPWSLGGGAGPGGRRGLSRAGAAAGASTSCWPPSPTATPSATRRWPSRATCGAAGFESDIFAEQRPPAHGAPGAAALASTREVSSPETVCLFHFSIGSAAGRLDLPRARPPGLDLPQHHAGGLLPRLPSPPGRALLPRPPRARRLRAAHRARPRATASSTAASWRRRVTRARACCRSSSTCDAYRPPASPVDAAALRRRPHEHALRRPHHPEQEDRGPDPRVRVLPALLRPAAAGCSWSATTAATSATTTACRSWCASCGVDEVVFTGPGGRRRAAAPTTRVRRPVPLPLRARGLLRAARWRRWPSACRWSPTTRARCARRCAAAGCC